MSEAIEKVALSIANAKRAKHDLPPCRWEHLTDEGKAEYAGYARAAIAAMPGWQPIDTAPKDGTPIWVANYEGIEPVFSMSHHFGEWTNLYSGHSIAWGPTHWRKFPDLPEVQS